MLRLVAYPGLVNMDVEMTMAELKGRLCSSRSLCAITAASGHLLPCLPGDCRCPWQPSLSQSTSAARRSLKLPAEPSWGCLEREGHGEGHRACGRAGGLAVLSLAVTSPRRVLVPLASLPAGLLHTWLLAGRWTLQTDLPAAALLGSEMG